MLGKQAPDFTLTTLDGKKVSLSDYKGRPVLVNFWATWCGPCKLEMPEFEEFRKQYSAQGLEILGLADDVDAGNDKIAEVAKKTGVTYPILLTDGKVQKAYGGLDVLPVSFYVDRNGKVVVETAGYGGKDKIEENIKKTIASGGTRVAGQRRCSGCASAACRWTLRRLALAGGVMAGGSGLIAQQMGIWMLRR